MKVIHKTVVDWVVPPNLKDYDRTRATFEWSKVPPLCADMPGGGCNIAYAAVDRHAEAPSATHTALRFISAKSWDGTMATRDLSYGELARLSRRFTNVLRSLSVNQGCRVFTVMGHTPELYITIMGSLRNGCVVAPLSPGCGSESLALQVNIGKADVLVTTKLIYQRTIAALRGRLPSVRHVLLIDGALPGTIDFWRWMDSADDDAPITPTTADDPALLHFTGGATGTPKGVLHVHGAVVMHYVTGLYALDLHPDDIFWCTADPGGVTGISYGVISPLLHGVISIVDEAEFDGHRWYRILQSQGVTVWYTTPTDLRMLIKEGRELAERFHFPRLRFIASVGESQNADGEIWGNHLLGLPIHENWCQTETGGIMIANTPAFDIKPGSMGRPLPGVDAYVVHHDDGAVAVIDEPNIEGELAFGLGWPSMFRSYLNEDERHPNCFTDGMYLTGDLVKRDADGYFWSVGRADDVIESTGHHPAVIGADYDNDAVQ